jgi:hypothetical protein
LNDAVLTRNLVQKKRLAKLTELSLAGNDNVTDDGLAFLGDGQRFDSITSLNLSDTAVTNKTLVDYLTKYAKLETLRLSNTRITDKGLSSLLERNRDLATLDLASTPTVVTEEVQSAIGSLLRLKTLNLSGTGVDDGGLKVIWGKQRDSLETQLQGTFQTEEQQAEARSRLLQNYQGLPQFMSMAKLESLDISRTAVTDRGLVDGDGSAGVRFTFLTLYTGDTRITSGGLSRYNALRRAFGPVTKESMKETVFEVIRFNPRQRP